ncbi:hypothetical protein GGR42_000632 [Saonia flava]|uniref:Secretion system C-terminal sorting domain-containing protein n=1 Tax=Saonia flava TaxID=523696 RepID=A0A846QT84_9FLAO|nr:T9SS C-terminal target domain-containing protein [Saonia flava]NJB70170.1 hypothetical protein [Saonia flava]
MKNIVFLLFLWTLGLFSQENMSEMGNLPMDVYESSGLLFYKGKLITHNDSGNTAQLFEIDTLTMSITRTITISNAENVDWEDISQDENFIYVGDFGNNTGDRQDLKVYRIAKSDYSVSTNVTADIILFSYEDQINFSTTQNSDWDAEALVVMNNELVVLTKQWESKGTSAYSMPKEPGSYFAKNIGDFPIAGMVTGATFNGETKELFMIGYSHTLSPFIAVAANVSNESIFSEVDKVNLNVGLAQIEGIAQIDENHFFISSEKFVNNTPSITLEAKLFSFKKENEIEIPVEEEGEDGEEVVVEEENQEKLILYKANGSNELHYQLNTNDEVYGQAIFNSLGKIISHRQGNEILVSPIDMSNYEAAIYYLTFYLQSGVVSKAFIRN